MAPDRAHNLANVNNSYITFIYYHRQCLELVGPSKQLKQKKKFKANVALLRFATGRRQTSWLFRSVAENLNSGLP